MQGPIFNIVLQPIMSIVKSEFDNDRYDYYQTLVLFYTEMTASVLLSATKTNCIQQKAGQFNTQGAPTERNCTITLVPRVSLFLTKCQSNQ
jgi:hypothetical protein